MLANPFDTIKSVLPIADILPFYGVQVKKQNQALCPLHREKTPSFTIYPATNSWHCFGCGAGGSAIDFVMAYCGIDALAAAKRLDADFHLGLFDCKSQPQRTRNDNRLATAFEGYMDKAYSLLCDYAGLLREWRATRAPKAIEASPDSLFVESCHQLDYIEWLLDCLLIATIDEQIQFYKTHRKELTDIAKRIKSRAA